MSKSNCRVYTVNDVDDASQDPFRLGGWSPFVAVRQGMTVIYTVNMPAACNLAHSAPVPIYRLCKLIVFVQTPETPLALGLLDIGDIISLP